MLWSKTTWEALGSATLLSACLIHRDSFTVVEMTAVTSCRIYE